MADIIKLANNLTTTTSGQFALDAAQGKILQEQISNGSSGIDHIFMNARYGENLPKKVEYKVRFRQLFLSSGNFLLENENLVIGQGINVILINLRTILSGYGDATNNHATLLSLYKNNVLQKSLFVYTHYASDSTLNGGSGNFSTIVPVTAGDIITAKLEAPVENITMGDTFLIALKLM